MRKAVRLSEQIRELESEVEVLLARVADLEQQHRLNLARYTCMRCLAEGLQAFQFLQAGRCSAAQSTDPSQPAEQLQSLLTSEMTLLQQLAAADGMQQPCCSYNSDSGVLDTGIDTICPHNDPMALFRALLEQAALLAAGTADVTADQLAQKTRQSTSQLSFQLNKLQAKMTAAEAAVAIRDIQNGHLQDLVTMVVAGRQDVVAKQQSFNLETMQADPSFLEAATQHTLHVAAHIGLTEQQAYAISTGMDLYLGLMEGIQTEQICLKFAVTGIEPSACDSSSADLGDRVEQLEEQEQLYQRLQLLLQKEYFMQFAMIGWLVGSLSYEQLAKATVLCWPYVLRLTHLGVSINQWYRQKHQHMGQLGCSTRSSA